MTRLKFTFILLTLLSSLLWSLDTPNLKLHDPKLKPVTLSSMKVDTQIVANIATSTYELSFFNPNNSIVEGELNFALMDGTGVIDYALEINGKWREASIVPKAKAKEAFENPSELTTFSQKLITKTFFFATLPYESKAKTKPLPNKIAIVYNTSFSNKDRDSSIPNDQLRVNGIVLYFNLVLSLSLLIKRQQK